MISPRSAARRGSKTGAYFIVSVLIWALIAFLVLPGCNSTVVPTPVKVEEASFDGNEQNSGVIASTSAGYIVTENFRARYNLLVARYGRDFEPALKPDGGLEPAGESRWLISKQAMVWFLTMNQWRRAGIEPRIKP